MCVMPENCVHIQNNKETTTGCGNVKHFATEEPTMPFFLCEVMPFFHIYLLGVTNVIV